MQDDFDLAAVLSITTGINCTDSYSKIYELFCFMFEDDLLNPLSIGYLKDVARKHILRIHPELKRAIYDPNIDIYDWINKQKILYGDKITISVIGENIVKLEKQSMVSDR